jgi:hypothetical protein
MNAFPRLAGLFVLLGVVVGCMPLLRTREVSEGQAAPPTEGTASDGRALRLSDFRGKVVLLCFWHGG